MLSNFLGSKFKLVRIFLFQELFEVLVDKDTKKKADAAREALLSEIELEAKKKKNIESKKKNKNQRKNKDPKVFNFRLWLCFLPSRLLSCMSYMFCTSSV